MKILITGAKGFIGSTLLASLPRDYEIICLDHSTYHDNLKDFVGENVRLIEGEIMDSVLVDKLMKDVDIVLHLAGGGGTPVCLEDPTKAVLTNINGTNILVNSAIKHNVKKFVFASSYLAYSVLKERGIPFTEEMKLEPDDFYGALKATAESSVMNFPGFVILRFSHIYGYGFRMQEGSLIMGFIKSAFDEKIISFKGSGNHRFDLLHVNDLCEAIKLVFEKDIKNEIINLGGGKSISINELSLEISNVFEKEFNKKIGLVKIEDENYKDWPDHWMDISKAKNLLNWKPKISLQEGVKEIIQKLK